MSWSGGAVSSEDWYARLAATLEEELADAVRLRRALHADPRPSGREADTAKAVLTALGAGPGRAVAGTGRVVRVLGEAGPTVALRAELDGLAVAEETGVPWAATSGIMHACGHDVHLAALVAVCRAVRRVGGPAPLLAVLQPREETEPSGAREIADSGVLEAEGVATVVAVHVQPQLPAGVVATTAGPVNAAIDSFTVTVSGHGGHGAYPHTTADPVLALSAVVLALQSQLTQRIDPVVGAVLAVTQLEAGSAFNIVPDTAVARGAVRSMRDEDRSALRRGMEEIAAHTAAAHGCRAVVEVVPGEPVLVNDPVLARGAVRWLERGGARCDDTFRSFGSDDFAHFCVARPGLMLFVGVEGGPVRSTGRGPGLHSAQFLPGEGCVRQAALALLAGYLSAAEAGPRQA